MDKSELQPFDKTDHKNPPDDEIVCNYRYTDVTDVVVDRTPKSSKQSDVFYCILALLVVVAPVAGCVMWFTSVPPWLNISILSFLGILGGIFTNLCDTKNDIFSLIIYSILHSLFYLLITAVLVAIIEGILWIGAWIF